MYMKTTIVCGLLGAGKTTFVQRFVENRTEKVVVLVNDFSKAGIDGEIFSAHGIESIELPSGCVCCTLRFDLITTIQRIMKNFSPEHLIIEPSGVASPSGVIEALDTLNIEPVTVVGIVDASEFIELYGLQMYGAFFEDQIVNSDVVLVNKIDLVKEDTTSRIVSIIEGINPQAIIFRTTNAAINVYFPEISRNQRTIKGDEAHFHFDTLSFRLMDKLELPYIERLFEDMAKGAYGNIVRAKALVRTDHGSFRFDLSYGKVNRTVFDRNISFSRLVVIGNNLKKGGFNFF